MIVIRARPHCEVPTQVRVTASLIAAARVITTHKMKREMMIIDSVDVILRSCSFLTRTESLVDE
jgi:hypothetical protein